MTAHEIAIVLTIGTCVALAVTRQAYKTLTIYSNYVSRRFLGRIACGSIILELPLLILIYSAIFDNCSGYSKGFAFVFITFYIVLMALVAYISIIYNRIHGG